MICPNCGKELPEVAKFCSSCGSPAEKRAHCAKCGKAIAPGQNFCSVCGTPVSNASSSANQRKDALPTSATANQSELLFITRLWVGKNFGSEALWALTTFGLPFRRRVSFYTDRIEFGDKSLSYSDVARLRMGSFLFRRFLLIAMRDGEKYSIGRPTITHIGFVKTAYDAIMHYLPEDAKG